MSATDIGDNTMQLGITMFSTCRGMSPGDLALACEERGFTSLPLAEHSHIPISRHSPFPGASPTRPNLPDVYWHINGPVTSLAMAAVVTERLVVGSSVTLLCQQDPIHLAKELATIDHYSGGGRVEVGVGFGWNREEMEAHGAVWSTRRERVRDAVAIMRALWRDHEASYAGEVLSLEPSWSYPKSVSPDGLPVLLGGVIAPKMLAHLVEWADGWIPILTPAIDLAADVATLRQAFEDAGRDPDSLRITICNAPSDAAGLEGLAALGVQRAALTVWAETRDDVLHQLDHFSRI